MTVSALPPPGKGLGGGNLDRLRPGSHPTRQKLLIGVAVVGGGFALLVALGFFADPTTRLRPNETRTVQVVLPPPPPPPPPPEPKPVEQPPEPTPMPVEQPQDTPPPEPAKQSSEPSAPGDNALTAREGAGPSSYGLAVGNGGGTRIGGRPGGGGGDAFTAYAQVAQQCIRNAAQSDRELSRGRYAVRLAVRFDPDGRIADVRVGEGDLKRQARIRQVLTGLQCSQRPPAGMPVTRVELRGG